LSSRKKQVSKLPFPEKGSDLFHNPASIGNYPESYLEIWDYCLYRHKLHASYFESLDTISSKTGWHKRTVQRALKCARKIGLFDWYNRPYNSNVYVLSKWLADTVVRAVVSRFIPSLKGLAIAFLLADPMMLGTPKSSINRAFSRGVSTYSSLKVFNKDLSSARGLGDASDLVKSVINNLPKTRGAPNMSDNRELYQYERAKIPQKAPSASRPEDDAALKAKERSRQVYEKSLARTAREREERNKTAAQGVSLREALKDNDTLRNFLLDFGVSIK